MRLPITPSKPLATAALCVALALLTFFQFPGHTWLQQDTQIEFQGAIHRLRKVAYALEAERLLNKDRLEGLNAVEKADLRRLLDEKRKLEVSP